jgi:hypothetical protein
VDKASGETGLASGEARKASEEARRKRGGWGDGKRLRKRRRREPRLPPPMKAGEGSLFRGERTERIPEAQKRWYFF